MDDYSVIIILAIMVVSLLIGYLCNKSYKASFGEDGFLLLPGILQVIFLVITLLTIPDSHITDWFIFGVVGTVLSYVIAIVCCYKKVTKNRGYDLSDCVKAIMAQVLLPIGSAILIILILAMFFSPKKKRRRRRR
jgi:hypothetical protein